MPYATATTPFTGDNNIADFMENVWLPFARDDCKWADNQAPSPNGAGTSANQIWTHRVDRGGSPTADLSPFTPKPPYGFFHTDGNQMAHYTGSGIDLTKQGWNQPGNPNNYWNLAGVEAAADLSSFTYINGRGILTNNIVGTFQKYWLFSDAEGRYIHCVIQPRAREYRHFHIGLLDALHPELNPDSFYISGHFWDSLYSNLTSQSGGGGNTEMEHSPYSNAGIRDGGHRTLTMQSPDGTESFGLPKAEWAGQWLYLPGLNAGYDFYVLDQRDDISRPSGALKTDGLSPQGEGVAIPSNYGHCQTNAYGQGLGDALFRSDKTFTSNTNSLVPILIGAQVTFSALTRLGVVAQIPDVYRINMRDYSAGEEITVGSDTYVVFPLINDDAANVLDGEGYSAYEGLAYKKITATVP